MVTATGGCGAARPPCASGAGPCGAARPSASRTSAPAATSTATASPPRSPGTRYQARPLWPLTPTRLLLFPRTSPGPYWDPIGSLLGPCKVPNRSPVLLSPSFPAPAKPSCPPLPRFSLAPLSPCPPLAYFPLPHYLLSPILSPNPTLCPLFHARPPPATSRTIHTTASCIPWGTRTFTLGNKLLTNQHPKRALLNHDTPAEPSLWVLPLQHPHFPLPTVPQSSEPPPKRAPFPPSTLSPRNRVLADVATRRRR